MNENIMRHVLKEAKAKDQNGLLVFIDWIRFEEEVWNFIPGKNLFEKTMKKVENDEIYPISTDYGGSMLPVAIGIPTKIMKDKETREKIMDELNKKDYSGPVLLLPSGCRSSWT